MLLSAVVRANRLASAAVELASLSSFPLPSTSLIAVSELPTHWVCNGFPYTLSYPGVDHHEKDVYSRNFTIPLSDPTSQQDVAASSSNKRAPSGTEAQDSSSTAKKKARR